MKSNIGLLKNLFLHFSFARRIKFIFLIILMVLSSLADVLSISAVLPFLAILTAPDILMQNATLSSIFLYFGYETANELIAPLTLVFLVSVVISSLLRIGQLVFNTNMAFAAGSEISTKVFQRTLSQDYISHKTQNSNDVLSIIATKIDDVIYRSIQPALQLISASLLVVFIVTFLMFLNPTIVFISVVVLASIYILISQLCYKLLASDSDNISLKRDDILRISNESLSSIRDIILSKSYYVFEQKYNKKDISLRRSQASIIVLSNIPRYILESISIIIIVAVAFFQNPSSSGFAIIAMLGTIAMAGQRLLPAFQQIYGSWATMTGNISPLNDVINILEEKAIETSNNYQSKIHFNKQIKLDGLAFSYPGKSIEAINGIDITIAKNSAVAFVGSTGCGKSTLMDIVLGLLHPDKGHLFIDDIPINNQSSIDAWHSLISHVPQNVYLTDATIAENITQCDEGIEINESLLINSAKDAQILDFILSTPDQFNTVVGENGSNLSGGQRQRIGIARSLYKKSSVIILDEATSALDNMTEHKIVENILRDKKRTVLMVSHSLQSVKKCDLIIEMHEGKIKSYGTFDELIETSSSFRELSILE